MLLITVNMQCKVRTSSSDIITAGSGVAWPHLCVETALSALTSTTLPSVTSTLATAMFGLFTK